MKNNEEKSLPVDASGLTEAEFLAGYDMTKYPRPSVTVDSVVLRRGEAPAVLLIKRGGHPFIYKWALPGGFLNMDESPEAAAERELYEETGVSGVTPRQVGAYGRPDRDPRGRIITIAYLMELPEHASPAASDDAADAGMFDITVDTEARRVRLTSKERGLTMEFHYRFLNGRAEYLGESCLAGDHAQVLADALAMAGILPSA